MKFLRLLTVPLVLTILSLNTQAQNSGPFLWTGYIDVMGNYLHAYSGGGVFSRFTPGVAITVTRVQLQAAQGSHIYSENNVPCSPVPKIRVTDGTTNYDLPIPNARWTGRYPMAVSADSGLIATSFSASSKLTLLLIPGQSGCNGSSINVTVQYTVN